MAGQGPTTKAYAQELTKAGWTVIYTCLPNAPHVGVVAIPIGASCKQHYPDILAYREQLTKIVEVEIQLSKEVALKISERFLEINEALNRQQAWQTLSDHIRETTHFSLPRIFVPDCELVICKNLKPSHSALIEELSAQGIRTLSRVTD